MVQRVGSEMLVVVYEEQRQTYVLAQLGSQLLQRLFLVFADGLQLKVLILESMELLDGQQRRHSRPRPASAQTQAPGAVVRL